ncbi:MAG: DUF4430 domain-containing protein, partial [Aminipila sp.]
MKKIMGICKNSIAFLLTLVLSISMIPSISFADTVPLEKVEETKNNLQLVEENLWEGIKGENTNVSSVTKNLKACQFASVDENGKVSFKDSEWAPGVNVKIVWDNIPDKYSDCIKKSTWSQTLEITRPSEDTVVKLGAVISNKPDDGQSKRVSIQFTIKGEITQNTLRMLCDEATKKKKVNYTEDSWIPFELALSKAKKVSESIYLKPTEDEIKSAYSELKAAMDGLVETGEIFNPLDYITDMELFKVIRSENLDKDNVTSNLTQTPLEYAKISDSGSVQWMSNLGWGENKANIKIKEWVSSNPEYIDVKGKYPEYTAFSIKRYPTTDLPITFTAKIISVGDYTSENLSKDVETTIILKSKKEEQFNPFTKINEELLFNLIKGENSDKNNITKDLINEYGQSFYATVKNNHEPILWHSTKNSSDNVEIIWKKSSQPTYVDVESSSFPSKYTAFSIKKYPEIDTNIVFTATLKNLDNNITQDIDVNIVLKAKVSAEDKIKAELNGYFDKHLKAENIEYAINNQEGIDFLKDYKENNVRYEFRLPAISALENLPYGTIKSKVTTDDKKTTVSGYVVKPVRNDVGGGKKTLTITYTMNKENVSVSRDFIIQLAPLTKSEIAHEVSILEKVKSQLAEGILGENYDQNNICHNLFSFQEVHWDSNDNLIWVMNANSPEKKAFGFYIPSKKDFSVSEPKYIDGKLNLLERPEKDVKVNISNGIESYLLGRYPAIYPENSELQKLGNQRISMDIVIKKLDANANKFVLGDKEIKVSEGTYKYSLLTKNTLEKIKLSVALNNMSAKLLINGNDFTNEHTADINLENGFRNIAIVVSDRDEKKESAEISNSYTVSIVSEEYLENSILTLPNITEEATEADKKLAKELLKQMDSLTDKDKNSISGKEKLEKYREFVEQPQVSYQRQLEEVAKKLFDGIKGNNLSSDMVFTNLENINYAKFTKDGIVWTKTADESDVKITWTSSDSPTYVNVFNGIDFESSYVEAFKLSKRPQPNEGDKPVTFYATLTHLKDLNIKKETSCQFILRAYDASLENLAILEFPDLGFDSKKTDYEVVYKSFLEKVTITPTSKIPNALISIDGKTITSNQSISLPLAELPHTIVIKINDGIRNTLNQKWDEKEYRITFKQNEFGEVDKSQLKKKLDEAKELDLTKYIYESTLDLNRAIGKANEVLSKIDALQSEINAATQSLIQSMKKLVELPNADKSEIDKLIDNVAWLSESRFTKGSWLVFEQALIKAVKDSNTPYIQQSELDKSKECLIEAKDALVLQNRTDATYVEGETVNISLADKNNIFNNIYLNDGPTIKTINVNVEGKNNSIVALQGKIKNLPNINIKRDNIVLQIQYDAILKEELDLELLTPTTNMAKNVAKKKIEKHINVIDEKVSVFDGYKFSSNKNIKLQKYSTILFKGMAGKSVVLVNSNGTIEDLDDNNGKGQEIYSEIIGDDLAIHTKCLDMSLIFYVVNSSDIGSDKPEEGTGKYVNISVDAKTIDKGYVIESEKVEISKGDSVWDVLKKAARKNKVSIDYRKSNDYENGIYVAGINSINEFDHGQYSGWMYNVNGKYPNYTCDKYILNENETVQWRYTTNLGEDLVEVPSTGGGSSSGGGGGGSSSGTTTKPTTPTTDNKKDVSVNATVSGNTATATIKASEAKNAKEITVKSAIADVTFNQKAIK